MQIATDHWALSRFFFCYINVFTKYTVKKKKILLMILSNFDWMNIRKKKGKGWSFSLSGYVVFVVPSGGGWPRQTSGDNQVLGLDYPDASTYSFLLWCMTWLMTGVARAVVREEASHPCVWPGSTYLPPQGEGGGGLAGDSGFVSSGGWCMVGVS